MGQNNGFNDNPNFNISSCDFNAWYLFQQPYVDVFHCNGLTSDFVLNHNSNIGINQSFNNEICGNLMNDFNNPVISDQHLFSRNIYNKNAGKNIKKSQIKCEKTIKSKRYKERKELVLSNLEPDENIPMNNKVNVKIDEHSFRILSRKKSVEVCPIKISKQQSGGLDIDVDFPPIISSVGQCQNFNINQQNKSLDFKLALQKPKKVEEITKDKLEEPNNEEDKIKKKRKRKRKKKAILEDSKPFEYTDEEFPNLDIVQKELSVLAEKAYLKDKEKAVLKLDHSVNDPELKKLRKRQLLFILPSGMEGQVRIVEAKSIKKSKTKRKVIRDRMKRPIGSLNPLDLSAPNVKRGKERLTPKVKKPSKLKKTILICRSQKKELRDLLKNKSLQIEAGDKIDLKDDVIEKVNPKLSSNTSNKIHSKNFREYCNHMISNNINSLISTLLKTLINFQDKLYNRDPAKARIKRRLCFGLREVTKFVNMKKLRLIIIAPDLEKVDIQGGLDDIVTNIIRVARESSIPCVFGLNRGSLAYICFKKFRVGAIGIFNFDGAEIQVKELLKAVEEAREQYNQLKQIMESITNDVAVLSEVGTHQFQSTTDDKDDLNLHNNCVYIGHSRTPSNALSEPISEIIEVNKSTFNSIFEDQNYHNQETKNTEILLNEDIEDGLVETFVDDVLNCVSKLNLND